MSDLIRASKYEVEQRVSLILDEILSGQKTTAEIRAEYPEKFGLTEASINKYIEKVYDILRKRAQQDFFTIFNVHLARYEFIYTKSWQYGFKKTAKRALKSKEKLLGLNQNVYNFFIQNEKTNVNVQTESTLLGYDLSILSITEKDRLKVLLDKCRR